MNVRREIIAGISGHPMSGLWSIHFENGGMAYVGSGSGVRALANCFGASEGRGDLFEKVKGQDIVFSVDCVGVLEAFTPIDEWYGPEIEIGEEIDLPE